MFYNPGYLIEGFLQKIDIKIYSRKPCKYFVLASPLLSHGVPFLGQVYEISAVDDTEAKVVTVPLTDTVVPGVVDFLMKTSRLVLLKCCARIYSI